MNKVKDLKLSFHKRKNQKISLYHLLFHELFVSKDSMVFPDSGASICLGGTRHLGPLGLKEKDLIPSSKIVKAVGGFKLQCKGWIPAEFNVGGFLTKQPLYICDKVNRIILVKTPAYQ